MLAQFLAPQIILHDLGNIILGPFEFEPQRGRLDFRNLIHAPQPFALGQKQIRIQMLQIHAAPSQPDREHKRQIGKRMPLAGQLQWFFL